MKPNQLFGQKHHVIIKVFLISLFLLYSLNLKAQTTTNFSGIWEFDKARSDKNETGNASFDGTIFLKINQNSDSMTCANTFILPDMKEYIMQPFSFFLDGRVTTNNEGTGPAKEFVIWSQDKKILTFNSIMTDSIDGVAQDFLTAYTYKISDDGKTLTIEVFYKSKLNGERTIKEVYKKK